VGQASCLPVEAASCCLVLNLCENDGKKEFGISFDKAAQLCFHFHNPTTARLAVASTGILFCRLPSADSAIICFNPMLARLRVPFTGGCL